MTEPNDEIMTVDPVAAGEPNPDPDDLERQDIALRCALALQTLPLYPDLAATEFSRIHRQARAYADRATVKGAEATEDESS